MDKLCLTEERETTANVITEQPESIENLYKNLRRLETENKELKISLQGYKTAWNDASERLHFVTSNIKNPSYVYNSFRDKCLKRFIENILMENYELRDIIKTEIHKTDGDVLCQENMKLKKKNIEINKLLLDKFKELQAFKKQTAPTRKDNSNKSPIKRCDSQVAALKQENMKLKTIVMLKNNIIDDIKNQFDKIADNCCNDFKRLSDIDSKELVTEIEKHKLNSQPVMPNFSKEPKKHEVKQMKQEIIDLDNKVKRYKGVEKKYMDLKQIFDIQIKQFNDQQEFIRNLHENNQQLEFNKQKLKNEYDTFRSIIKDNFDKLPNEIAEKLQHQESVFSPSPPEFHGSKSTPSFPSSNYERAETYKRSVSDKLEMQHQRQLPLEPYQSVPRSTGVLPEYIAVRDCQKPAASSCDNVSTNQKEEKEVQGNVKKDNEELGMLFVAAESNDLGLFKDITGGTNIDLNSLLNNETILHHAVRHGSKDIIQHLLRTDINIHAFGQQQQTILHFAASQSNPAVLKLLLDNVGTKLDPNAQDIDGKTALHVAVCNNNIDNVALLVKVTNISITDKNSMTAYNYAYKKKNSEIIKLLRP